MIKIHAHELKQAGKLLKRLPSHRSTLPVLTHIAAIANFDTLSIVTANLDQRLETRIPLAEPISSPESILIPPDAFQAALKADKDSIVRMILIYHGSASLKAQFVTLRRMKRDE